MRTIDPALPRIGTDFMTLRVIMRIVYPNKPLAVISIEEPRRTSSGKGLADSKLCQKSEKLLVATQRSALPLGVNVRPGAAPR